MIDVKKNRFNKKVHLYCDYSFRNVISGWKLFLHYLTNVGDSYDPKTFMTSCPYCGALIEAPLPFVIYVEIWKIVSPAIVLFSGAIAKMILTWFVLQLAFTVVSWFLIGRVIPAILACICTWKDACFAGAQEQFLEERRKIVSSYKPFYRMALFIGFVLMCVGIAVLLR